MAQQSRTGAETEMPRLSEQIRKFMDQAPALGLPEDQLLSMFGGFVSQVQEASAMMSQRGSATRPAGVGVPEETTAVPRGAMPSRMQEILQRR